MKISVSFPNDKEAFAFLEEMSARFRLDSNVRVDVEVENKQYTYHI